MNHSRILQPLIVISQQPNVVDNKYKICNMAINEKIEFSKPLSQILIW